MKYNTRTDIFRARIAVLIKSLGMNQNSFAKRIGVTPAAMSMMLNGQREPSFHTLKKIKDKTGASLDFLFGDDK